MAKRYFPGATVDGRRPRPNPHTVSGYPRWNTYQGLGSQPVSFDGMSNVICRGDTVKDHKSTKYTPCRKKGSGKKKKRVAPENLCHRMRKTTGQNHFVNEDHFEAARKLIVTFSQTKHDVDNERFGVHLAYLKERKSEKRVSELMRLVLARGCTPMLRWWK